MLRQTLSVLLVSLGPAIADISFKCDGQGEHKCVASGDVGNDPTLVQGDILVNEDAGRNAVLDAALRWPDNTIPYTFHETYTKNEQAKVERAMKELSGKTCVKFVPWTGSGEVLVITKGEGGCYANVGMAASWEIGHPNLNLRPKRCFDIGTILHELLHVTGLYHEQSRPDRDDFVDIDWSNIIPGNEHNFNKYGEDVVTTYGVPYDYQSIMHYGNKAFALDRSKHTISAKNDTNMTLGQREAPTPRDIKKVRRMYQCYAAGR